MQVSVRYTLPFSREMRKIVHSSAYFPHSVSWVFLHPQVRLAGLCWLERESIHPNAVVAAEMAQSMNSERHTPSVQTRRFDSTLGLHES